MSEPAWKRAGLKKQGPKKSYDPLKEGLKRSSDGDKISKPAKKVKLPKNERPAKTHELDQLFYLRQYFEDRANWKFSKQKQNWILKHMFTDITDKKYDDALIAYIDGLQGSARNWVVDDAKEVVNKWNVFMKVEEEKKEEKEAEDKDETKKQDIDTKEDEESKDKSNKEVSNKDENTVENNKNDKTKENKSTKSTKENKTSEVPTEQMARRAQTIILKLTGESVKLELLDSIN